MPNDPFDPAEFDLASQAEPARARPGDYLRFVLRSGRRRPILTLGVLMACWAVLGGYYAAKAPLYRAETRILAQRQASLPSITRSNVAEDQPTRAAWEIIHRRDNLLDLVGRAGLVESAPKWDLIERLRMASSPATDAQGEGREALENLLVLLDRRLKVEVGEVTIAIEIDWPDAQQAYRIIDGALQNFFEARHVQDVTALDETISILQGRAAVLRDELSKVTEETRWALQQDASRAARAQPPLPAAPQLPPPASEELVRLKSLLDAKTRSIGDVEEFRRRRLAELQAQYDARRAIYAEAHPEMANLRLDIAALNRDSPQITALREEERRLHDEYQARLAREPAARAVPGPASPQRPLAEGINAGIEQSERVREARFRYQQILESVNAAQIELDTARSAFKHRYKVIWPAQVPKRPFSPNPVKIFGLGGLASLLLALLAAAAADWRTGRVLERWQVERGLELPVIAELRRR